MSLYKRTGSPYYWAKIYVKGRPKPYRLSTQKSLKSEALIAERKFVEDLSKLPKASDKSKTLIDVVTDFLEWRTTHEKPISEMWLATLEDYFTRCIIPYFGALRDIVTITDDDLKGFKKARLLEVGAITVSKELAALRQLFKYAKEEGIIDRVPQVTNPPHRYTPKWNLLTPEQLDALLQALAKRRSFEVFPLELLRANTGLRPTEARRVMWEWVDWEGKRLNLPAEATKTKDARVIDLNEGALHALRMMWREGAVGRVFSLRKHRTAWYRACVDAGLGKKIAAEMYGKRSTGIRPHDLRHTFGSLLHRSGANLPVINATMGHKTLFMANLYAHAFDDDRKAAVNAISIVPSVPKNVPKRGQKRSKSGHNGQNRSSINFNKSEVNSST